MVAVGVVDLGESVEIENRPPGGCADLACLQAQFRLRHEADTAGERSEGPGIDKTLEVLSPLVVVRLQSKAACFTEQLGAGCRLPTDRVNRIGELVRSTFAR